MQHRDGRRATALCDDLREPGQARHGREAGFFAEEGGHLEVGVESRLQPSICLEQEALAEDDGRVRLVRAEIPFRAGTIAGQVPERRRWSADEHGGGCLRRVLPARERRDRPALGDRDGERPPRTVAGKGFPKRLPGQGQAVGLPAPVVQRQLDKREGVRPRRVEHERLIERGVADRPSLGSEPAGIGDGGGVECGDGGLDGGSSRSGDLRSPY